MLIKELFESFDSEVEYKVIKNAKYQFEATAIVNGRKLLFVADRIEQSYQSNDNVWDISFAEHTPKVTTYKLTGNGGEFKVFTLLKKFVTQLIKDKNPAKITFTASKATDSKRADVYHRMFEKFNFPSYQLIRINGKDSDSFSLEKT